MEIRYQETTSDLLTRIDIHKKYGGRDIDRWMLDLLAARKGSRILDVGCGAGKQCFAFFDELGGDCEVTGGDVSKELLERARLENARTGNKIRFVELDFGRRFDFEDAQFDLVSACFTIYYAKDIPFTISEMHRVLAPAGACSPPGPCRRTRGSSTTSSARRRASPSRRCPGARVTAPRSWPRSGRSSRRSKSTSSRIR